MTLDLITPASPAGYLTSEGANRERSFLTSVFPILPASETGSGKQKLPSASESSEDGKHLENTVFLVLLSSHVLAAHTPMQGAGLAVPAPDYAHPIFLLVCFPKP